MAYDCLGIRLTLVMCLMLDIKLTLYQKIIYMVSCNRENSFQSYIIQQYLAWCSPGTSRTQLVVFTSWGPQNLSLEMPHSSSSNLISRKFDGQNVDHGTWGAK